MFSWQCLVEGRVLLVKVAMWGSGETQTWQWRYLPQDLAKLWHSSHSTAAEVKKTCLHWLKWTLENKVEFRILGSSSQLIFSIDLNIIHRWPEVCSQSKHRLGYKSEFGILQALDKYYDYFMIYIEVKKKYQHLVFANARKYVPNQPRISYGHTTEENEPCINATVGSLNFNWKAETFYRGNSQRTQWPGIL